MANTTAAIMAIPSPLEPIRLVGDEDKHTTLLFFGDTSTLAENAKQTLIDSVKTASSMLFPFSESVRDVSRLGSENPPALVAMLTGSNLSQIRNLFSMNPDVKSYLDNTAQFPSFTPHMTLAYPDFADEIILRSLMRDVYRVRFDRLAVWWNDEHIEFQLSLGAGEDSMAMSDAIGEFLEHCDDIVTEEVVEDDDAQHHGIKGMKWGVRRPVSTSTGLVSKGQVRVTVKDSLNNKVSGGSFKERHAVRKALKAGVVKPDIQIGPNKGLKARTSSEDQIHQDRIAKKIKEAGSQSLSNRDIQDYTRRLQLQQDLTRALATQSAAAQKKADGFIKSFVKSQANRQFNRVADKALDIAVEKALLEAGLSIGKKGKSPDAADALVKISKRLAPKKGK